jgi:hypothetical protein
VVVRYPSHRAWTDARNEIADKRSALSDELTAADIDLEEVLLLDEVV